MANGSGAPTLRTDQAISYSPGGGGAMMKPYPSDTACTTPGSAPKTLFAAKVSVNSGELTR